VPVPPGKKKERARMWFALQDCDGEGFMDIEVPTTGPELLGKCWARLAYKFMCLREPIFIQNGYVENQEKELNEEYLVMPSELVIVRLKSLRNHP
jgi:hypothetical protein